VEIFARPTRVTNYDLCAYATVGRGYPAVPAVERENTVS
jgi:hypothetical protein